jgi:hypothetical protein
MLRGFYPKSSRLIAKIGRDPESGKLKANVA